MPCSVSHSLTLQESLRCLHAGLLRTSLAGRCKLLVDRAQGAGPRSPPVCCIFPPLSGTADNRSSLPFLCQRALMAWSLYPATFSDGHLATPSVLPVIHPAQSAMGILLIDIEVEPVLP